MMVAIEVYIYSNDDDELYAHHLDSLCKCVHDIKIYYKIGKRVNCDSFYSDDHNIESIVMQSYTHLDNYQRIPNSFLWADPSFNFFTFENKHILISKKIDATKQQSIKSLLVLPQRIQDIQLVRKLSHIKNSACCTNRVTICLR